MVSPNAIAVIPLIVAYVATPAKWNRCKRFLDSAKSKWACVDLASGCAFVVCMT